MADDDAALLTATRAGDPDAYAQLYLRHVHGARRLAGRLSPDPGTAEDLVSEAFVKILAALLNGCGPTATFRAYLYTAVRNAYHTKTWRDRLLEFTDDLTPYDRGVRGPEADLDRRHAIRAFARLPHRLRVVLWHTAVEGVPPAQLAPRLGLTPGGVAVLAFRARARLRQMYHQEHGVGTLPR